MARYWLVTRLDLEPNVGRRRATLAMLLHEECLENCVIEHGSAINTPRVGDIRRNSFQRTKIVTPTQKYSSTSTALTIIHSIANANLSTRSNRIIKNCRSKLIRSGHEPYHRQGQQHCTTSRKRSATTPGVSPRTNSINFKHDRLLGTLGCRSVWIGVECCGSAVAATAAACCGIVRIADLVSNRWIWPPSSSR